MSLERDLHVLLKQLYSNAELHLLVKTGELCPDVTDALPPHTTTSKDDYTAALVETMVRRGHVDAAFFDTLVSRERARFEAARTFAAAFGAEPAASTVEATSAENSIDEEVLRFLSAYRQWGFNAARVCRWGGRQDGFEILSTLDRWSVFAALQRLERAGRVRVFIGKKGTPLYKFQSFS